MQLPSKYRTRVLRYRMLADGYSTLKSPLAEQYANAAEALERLADEVAIETPSVKIGGQSDQRARTSAAHNPTVVLRVPNLARLP
jgi:hypothetical protein